MGCVTTQNIFSCPEISACWSQDSPLPYLCISLNISLVVLERVVLLLYLCFMFRPIPAIPFLFPIHSFPTCSPSPPALLCLESRCT